MAAPAAGAVMSEPTMATEVAPETAPMEVPEAVEPPVEAPAAEGDEVAPEDGARNQLRTPMVDPNAFVIEDRGYGN